MKKITTEETIKKFTMIHADLYDYSKVEYKKAKEKVIVICKKHGEFLVTPNNHISGYGCPKCSGKGFEKEERLKNFIEEAHKIHNMKYDYSIINEIKSSNCKVNVICEKHGIFKVTPNNHISGKTGCPECSKIKRGLNKRNTKEEFVKKSIKKHGKKYSYDNTVYNGAHEKLYVTCKKHGDFLVSPVNHWSNGVGCPNCLSASPSKGEKEISMWLETNKIEYDYQKSFEDLYHKSKKGRLKYDFYIPYLNMLIEYDGEYHYKPITFSKNIKPEKQFEITKERDRLKTIYAEKNGFNLLRIRFDDNILEMLEANIKP